VCVCVDRIIVQYLFNSIRQSISQWAVRSYCWDLERWQKTYTCKPETNQFQKNRKRYGL